MILDIKLSPHAHTHARTRKICIHANLSAHIDAKGWEKKKGKKEIESKDIEISTSGFPTCEMWPISNLWLRFV